MRRVTQIHLHITLTSEEEEIIEKHYFVQAISRIVRCNDRQDGLLSNLNKEGNLGAA